jgi:uncharacterized protein YjiS (DUF1127 family)
MSILASIAGFLERRRREARTRYELEQLTDRELADLGIVRADIGRLARESAEGGLVDIHTWRTGTTAGASAALARQGV